MVPQNKWLARLTWVAAFTLFFFVLLGDRSFLDHHAPLGGGGRGRLAHRQVAEDTWPAFGGRALVGGAAGFLISLLPVRTRHDRSRTP